MKKETYQPIMSTEYKNWYIIPNAPKEILANEKGFILNTVTGNITRGSWVGHYLRYRWQGVNYYMQRLIALAFKGIPKYEGMIVNHIDGNKRNNKPDNLEWITQQDNVIHAYKNGLYKNKGINRSIEDFYSRDDILIPLFEYDHHMNPEYMSEIVDRELKQFEDYTYTTLYHHKKLYKPLYDITLLSTSEKASLAEIQLESSHGRYVPGVLYYLTENELQCVEDFRNGKYHPLDKGLSATNEAIGVINVTHNNTINKNTYVDKKYINLVNSASRYHSDYFYNDVVSTTDKCEYEILYKDYLI